MIAQLDLFTHAAPWWRMCVPTPGDVLRWSWYLCNGTDCSVALIFYVAKPGQPYMGKAKAQIRDPFPRLTLDRAWLFGAGEAPAWFVAPPWGVDRCDVLTHEAGPLDALAEAWACIEAAGAPRRPACWRVLPEPVDPAVEGWVREAGLPEGWPA